MRIIKLKNNRYKVESSSKGKFYSVDLNAPFCDCPQFMFREKARGGKCKHILAIEEKYGNKPKQKVSQKTLSSFSKIIEEVKQKEEVETVVLMEKYGEKEVQELIDRGELIETKGKVKITE
jgi:predicted nucleic acid-binding Zn finger protein